MRMEPGSLRLGTMLFCAANGRPFSRHRYATTRAHTGALYEAGCEGLVSSDRQLQAAVRASRTAKSSWSPGDATGCISHQ